jgi:hypothetical protein
LKLKPFSLLMNRSLYPESAHCSTSIRRVLSALALLVLGCLSMAQEMVRVGPSAETVTDGITRISLELKLPAFPYRKE